MNSKEREKRNNKECAIIKSMEWRSLKGKGNSKKASMKKEE